jgi:hypothetical protein
MCAHSRPVQDCQSSEVTEPPALKASTGCRELTPHPHPAPRPTVTCGGVTFHFELMNTAIGVSLNMGHSTVNNRIHELSFAEF